MTNLSDGVNDTEVEAGPVDDGQAADTETGTPAPPPEPEREYLSIDEAVASKYVKVKDNGEEVDVLLPEALQGYQRHSDYTRKTQEAAALREQAQEALRLQQALQVDPGLTVQVLARNAGVSVEEFLGMTPRQQQAVAAAVEDEYADPLEGQLAQERQARLALEERINQRDADDYLRAQVQGLKQAYQIGDDEVREVIQQAMRMKVGPEAFPMIYQSLAYQKLQVQSQAQQDAAAAAAADDARRRAAAVASTGVVSTGTGATNVTTVPPANVHMSPRDAVLAAFDQLEA